MTGTGRKKGQNSVKYGVVPRNTVRKIPKHKKLSSGRCEFGDGLSSLRDGMLGELAGKNKFNCSLNLP